MTTAHVYPMNTTAVTGKCMSILGWGNGTEPADVNHDMVVFSPSAVISRKTEKKISHTY